MTIDLPLRIVSVANESEGWRRKATRTKKHRKHAWLAMLQKPKPKLPCIVKLIRIAPRELDGDNLQSAFKAVRDGIADRLGMDDRDPRVVWIYAQERGKPKEYSARIQIDSMPKPINPQGVPSDH